MKLRPHWEGSSLVLDSADVAAALNEGTPDRLAEILGQIQGVEVSPPPATFTYTWTADDVVTGTPQAYQVSTNQNLPAEGLWKRLCFGFSKSVIGTQLFADSFVNRADAFFWNGTGGSNDVDIQAPPFDGLSTESDIVISVRPGTVAAWGECDAYYVTDPTTHVVTPNYSTFTVETNSTFEVWLYNADGAAAIGRVIDLSDFITTVTQYTILLGFSDPDMVLTNISTGLASSAFGINTQATAEGAFSEGVYGEALAFGAHAEGYSTSAIAPASHAEGGGTYAQGYFGHAEGEGSSAGARTSHAEGFYTHAIADFAHSEGNGTEAAGKSSHSEGESSSASGQWAHAEGYNTIASGDTAHAEGYRTTASGGDSHAEGSTTTAAAAYSHAEGFSTSVDAAADGAHAEGYGSIAMGFASHAEGSSTTNGQYSHAQGVATVTDVNAPFSHAEGYMAKTRMVGESAHGFGSPFAGGVSQFSRVELGIHTLDATVTHLTIPDPTGVTPAEHLEMGLFGQMAVVWRGMVIARKVDGTVVKAWTLSGLARANASGVVTLVVNTTTAVGGDAGASAWTVAVVAATIATTGILRINVTGAAATSIDWSCTLETQQISTS